MKVPSYRMSSGHDKQTGEYIVDVYVQRESNPFGDRKSCDAVRKRMVDLKMPRSRILLDYFNSERNVP
jgi:hypothetical protein